MITLEKPISKTKTHSVCQTIGRITAVLEGKLNVQTSDGTFRATRAVSCLVAPEEGDLVLLAGQRSTTLYVLAVLERPGNQHARIATEGNLTFDLRSGQFTVAATEGINLFSKQAVSMVADRVEARAREGNIFLGAVNVIAGAVSSTLDRLTQNVKRVFRRVEEIEHVRAGQIDYTSEGMLRMHGENTLLTARELVKANGKQIHIG